MFRKKQPDLVSISQERTNGYLEERRLYKHRNVKKATGTRLLPDAKGMKAKQNQALFCFLA